MIGDIYTKGSDILCSMDMFLKDIDLDDNTDMNRVLLTSPSIDIFMNGNSNELPPDNFLTFISEPTFDDILDIEEDMDFSNLNKNLAYVDKINLSDDFDLLKLNKSTLEHNMPQSIFVRNANFGNSNIDNHNIRNDLSLNQHHYPSPNSSIYSENHVHPSIKSHKHLPLYFNDLSQLHAGHIFNSLPTTSALPLSPVSLPSLTYVENNLYDPNHYKHLCRNNPPTHTKKEPVYPISGAFDSNLDTIFDLDLEDDLYEVKEENNANMDVQPLFNANHNFKENNDLAGLSSSFLTDNSSFGDSLPSENFNSCPNYSAQSPSSFLKPAPGSYAFTPPIRSPYSSISSNDISVSPFNPKDRKKIQNKIAAAKYRQKKKEEAKNVMFEESILKESNILLKNKLACLVQEINMLKNLIK